MNKFISHSPDSQSENELIDKINNKITVDNRLLNICISDITLRGLIRELNKEMGHDGIQSKLLQNSCNNFFN